MIISYSGPWNAGSGGRGCVESEAYRWRSYAGGFVETLELGGVTA
jgi:hypothetical protein